jgi:hypothetical protein
LGHTGAALGGEQAETMKIAAISGDRSLSTIFSGGIPGARP